MKQKVNANPLASKLGFHVPESKAAAERMQEAAPDMLEALEEIEQPLILAIKMLSRGGPVQVELSEELKTNLGKLKESKGKAKGENQ